MWREAGVNVVISTCNVSKLEETRALMTEAGKLGPVGGIFNLAMVLQDGLIENQTVDMFRKVADAKVTGNILFKVDDKSKIYHL